MNAGRWKRLAPHAAIVMASVALAIALSLLLELAAGIAKALWFTGTMSSGSTTTIGSTVSWASRTDVLGPHSPIAWQSTIVLSGVIAWLVTRASLRQRLHGSTHHVLAAVVLATLSQMPSIADWIEEHESQSLPRFRLELVAARATEGRAWMLDRDDTLVISDADVERVRWLEASDDGRPGISIRFDAPTGAAVRERSIRRVGKLDAIVVDTKVELVPSIESVLFDGALALHVSADDRGRLAELYVRLTGRAVPSR